MDLGNNIVTVDAATAQSDWLPVVEPIIADWIADMDSTGNDGQALIDRAKGLMNGECKGANAEM